MADAHASFGTYTVLQGWSTTVSEDGLRAFDSALHLDPTFALAYNGRGCIRFGDGEFEEAAADFQKAAQLLPSLAIIDANEGIAVAYATRQLTLASLDANPSMALVSINRRDELVKGEDRDLQRLIPDRSIRNKILAYPHLSPAEQSELRNKVGKELIIRVQAVELHKADAEMWRLHREQLQLNKDIRAGARSARVLAVVEGVASVGTAAWNSVKALKEGWKAYVGGRGLPKDMATITAASARDRRMDLIKYLVFGGNPVTTTAIAGLKIAQDVNSDRLGANDARSQMLYNQFMAQALKSQASSQTLADLGTDWKPAQVPAPSPSVSLINGPSWVASSVPLSRLPTPTRPIANGVTTEAIGHAIVDKGDWPVMTTFTLGYRPASEAGRAEGPRAEGRRTRGG